MNGPSVAISLSSFNTPGVVQSNIAYSKLCICVCVCDSHNPMCPVFTVVFKFSVQYNVTRIMCLHCNNNILSSNILNIVKIVQYNTYIQNIYKIVQNNTHKITNNASNSAQQSYIWFIGRNLRYYDLLKYSFLQCTEDEWKNEMK